MRSGRTTLPILRRTAVKTRAANDNPGFSTPARRANGLLLSGLQPRFALPSRSVVLRQRPELDPVPLDDLATSLQELTLTPRSLEAPAGHTAEAIELCVPRAPRISHR